MINTISKTLEAQEKTQDIKQSPSMKIGTKPYAREQRNELTEVPDVGPDAGRSGRTLEESDRTLRSRGSATGVTERWTGRWRQIDRTQDSRVQSSTERFQSDKNAIGHVRWHVTGRVRSGRDQRPVSSRKAGFHPQRLLSQWSL